MMGDLLCEFVDEWYEFFYEECVVIVECVYLVFGFVGSLYNVYVFVVVVIVWCFYDVCVVVFVEECLQFVD